MKALLATLLAAAAPTLALAQAAPASVPASAPAHKPATKPAAKSTAKRPPAKHETKHEGKKAEDIKAVEEATPLEEPDPSIKLTDAELEIAKKVFVGEIPCELGATVKIRPLHREGFFLLQIKATRFVMHPVESRTGALRLEDPERGALWLQLGNKSMLMSQKLGQRLADECQSPDQKTFAEALKLHPINLLEPVKPASAAASAANPPAKAGPN